MNYKSKMIIVTVLVSMTIFGLFATNAEEPSTQKESYVTRRVSYKPNPDEQSRNGIILEQLNWDKKNTPPQEGDAKKKAVSENQVKSDTVEVSQPIQISSRITHTSVLPNLVTHYNTYKQYYELAEGCHPYILASIHYREKNFGNTNGWNGQGAFQNIRNRYPAESVVTDWGWQVQQACEHLRQSVNWIFLTDLNDQESIGNALAKYNGCRGLYYKQCSYVVNKTNLMAVGTKCAVDGCAYTTTDNRYGALSIISQLQSLSL